MPATFRLLAALVFGFAIRAEAWQSQAPSYTAASLVNAASSVPGDPLAPNTIASLYGTGLSFTTRAISPGDVSGGFLPTVLPGTGVRVFVGSLPANLYYVSPTQINLLIPSELIAGPTNIRVTLDGRAGPTVPITLASTAPALFEWEPETIIATRPNGSLYTKDSPAHPGQYVVLYSTGLGETVPPIVYGMLPVSAAPLVHQRDLRVLLDGVAVDSKRIQYAGIAPTLAGVYQINLRLPNLVHDYPELRIGFGDQLSPPGLKIWAAK